MKKALVLIFFVYFPLCLSQGKYLLYFQPLWCSNGNGLQSTNMGSQYKNRLKKIWAQAGVKIVFLPDIRFRDTAVNTKLTTQSKFNLARRGNFVKADQLMSKVTAETARKYGHKKLKVIFCFFIKKFNSQSRGAIIFPSARARAFANIIVSSTHYPHVLAHELGHNLSLQHTNQARLMRSGVPSNPAQQILTEGEKKQAIKHGLSVGKLVESMRSRRR